MTIRYTPNLKSLNGLMKWCSSTCFTAKLFAALFLFVFFFIIVIIFLHFLYFVHTESVRTFVRQHTTMLIHFNFGNKHFLALLSQSFFQSIENTMRIAELDNGIKSAVYEQHEQHLNLDSFMCNATFNA